MIGNYQPRKCGIATFTADVVEQLRAHHPELQVDVYALDDPAARLDYEGISQTIPCDDQQGYRMAARRINESGADAVWLQHEYGIFGGDCGDMVCDFVDRLAPPLILTLHTVLCEPSRRQESILRHLVTRASRIMVMSQHSRDLLMDRYDTPQKVIEVIEHGAPDRPFGRQAMFKDRMGLAGRKVMTTFGLLGPGKGLEHVIEALPEIVRHHPEVLYRIVGATHPKLVAQNGEAYREQLERLAEERGVADHIVWENRFLETPELLDQLEASDIYLTPYPNLQQSTSGTLSYAVALGKAVISTPYVHARELLANDAGVLIEPNDPAEIARAVNALLSDPARLHFLQRRAYARGRETIWPCFAARTAALVRSAIPDPASRPPRSATPGLSAVLTMSDATGMLQHSIGIVPDRRHGYCLDDNVRALMLMNVAPAIEPTERTRWSSTYASFIQYAWNPEAGRFRNFMRYDRTWCEDIGSQDSNGRALWSLGHTIEHSPDPDIREWACDWYARVLPHLSELEPPRARAFAGLGACCVLRVIPGHEPSRRLALQTGQFLNALLGEGRRPDWTWFEAVLGYDNPRLCQAMIEIGTVLDDQRLIELGLETLDWIAARQISARRQFRPIGSETFGKPYDSLPFDQQPLEVQAAIEAAGAAWRATGEQRWVDHALSAWDWLFGSNDRGACLAEIRSGRCRDGLTRQGMNRNSGAESILAFQLSHVAIMAMIDGQGAASGLRKSGANAY